jgi:hypothetical protein
MVKLDNTSYNKIKLLHKLSCINWFIEKHAQHDAETAGDQEFLSSLIQLQKDLEKHIEKLQHGMCTITQ